MNLFNTIQLLAELGSKIGNIEIDNKFNFDFKKMRELNNLSFVNHIPDFNPDINHIFVNGKKVMLGTIVKRPLDIIPILSSANFEYHYAIVLGTSTQDEEMLIEMTKSRNVSIVTKQDFLANKFTEQQIIIESLPPQNITREVIIEKAKEFQFDSYNLLDLNCKVFVEYVIWNIAPPQRKLELKKVQLQLCDIAISILELQLADPANEEFKASLSKRLSESKKDKERLLIGINSYI